MFAHTQEPVVPERSSRGGFRGRGGGVERYRGQGDWKVRNYIDDSRPACVSEEYIFASCV